MHDAERAARLGIERSMDALEPAEDLACDEDRDADGQELALLAKLPEQSVAVDPIDVLHREVGLTALVLAGVVDGDDVLVRDRRVKASLAMEHRPALWVLREMGEQPLDDELLREVRGLCGRMREINLRRSTDGDSRVEDERAESSIRAHRAEMVAIPPSYVTNA